MSVAAKAVETVDQIRERIATAVKGLEGERSRLALQIGLMLIEARTTFEGDKGVVDKTAFLAWTDKACELKSSAYLYIQAAEVAQANPAAVEKLTSASGRVAVRSLALLHRHPVKTQNQIIRKAGKNPTAEALTKAAAVVVPPKVSDVAVADRKLAAICRKHRDAVSAAIVAAESLALTDPSLAIREGMYAVARMADGLMEKAIRKLVAEYDNPVADDQDGKNDGETPPGVDPDPTPADVTAAENAALAAAGATK